MEKQGVFTGAYAINPLSHERVPIWVTNYVLAEYGTGAVMGVPAHDERDFDFAKQHGLPIAQVIAAPGGRAGEPLAAAFVEDGRLIASDEFSGMSSARAREALAERLAAMGAGGKSVNYQLARLADLTPTLLGHADTRSSIARRAARCPFPTTAADSSCRRACAFTGEGSPLALDSGVHRDRLPAVRRPGTARERHDGHVLRIVVVLSALPRSAQRPPCRGIQQRAAKWMNVDQYIGGAEHAVLHLLYSRFFYKFFHDRGWVSGPDEPFERLFHQGMVLHNGEKMSKSRGNVVGIDETAEKQRRRRDAPLPALRNAAGRDEQLDRRGHQRTRAASQPRLARLRTAFSSTPHAPRRSDYRRSQTAEEKALLRAVHVAAKSAIDETLSRRFHYNTTIAKLDELVNRDDRLRSAAPASPALLYAVAALPILIAPFAPHIAEELWARLGSRELRAPGALPRARRARA